MRNHHETILDDRDRVARVKNFPQENAPTNQPRLRFDDRFEVAEAWPPVRDAIRSSVQAIGRKKLTKALDCNEEVFAQALTGHDRHHLRAQWLVGVNLLSASDELIGLLCAQRGGQFFKPQPITDRERCERYEAALQELGPLADVLRQKHGLK